MAGAACAVEATQEDRGRHGVAQRGRSSRTRVTSILNGNLDKVSSDLLIRLLAALGYRVKVSVSRVDSAA